MPRPPTLATETSPACDGSMLACPPGRHRWRSKSTTATSATLSCSRTKRSRIRGPVSLWQTPAVKRQGHPARQEQCNDFEAGSHARRTRNPRVHQAGGWTNPLLFFNNTDLKITYKIYRYRSHMFWYCSRVFWYFMILFGISFSILYCSTIRWTNGQSTFLPIALELVKKYTYLSLSKLF